MQKIYIELEGIMGIPKGFGYQGAKLWHAVTEEFDLTCEPHKRRILEDACRAADVVDELAKGRKSQPLTVKGSQGQPVINPLIAEERVQRALLAQLLARLNFEALGDEDG